MTHAFIGLMVLYRLTQANANNTNMRREDAANNIEKMRAERPGFQAHVGNPVGEGERVPMTITRIDVPTDYASLTRVNGQAFLDGNDSLWVTGVAEGDQPGEWEAITDG